MVRLLMSEKNTRAEAICESDETHELKELIRDLMSDSNDKRSDAKSILEICIYRHDPHVFANKLYRVLSSSIDPKSRTISAILLRKSFIIKSYVRFRSFPVETQSTLKRDLLKLVDTPATPINKELCHTVSALAASLLPKKEWPEFLSFLFKLVESDKNRALLIVTYLAQYLGKGLNKLHLDKELHSVNLDKELHSVLLQCLKTTTEGEDVRITVLGAAINFILCLEQKDLVNFQEMLTAMMSTLKKALYSGNETMADAINTLKLLINLAGMKPTFLRKQIVEMVKTVLLMADDHSLEKGTRRLAIEFVLTLLQFVLTLAEVEKTNPGLLKLGTEFEINMEEMWDDNEETDNYESGEFCHPCGLIRFESRFVRTQYYFTNKKNNYGPWQGCRLSILSYRNNISTVALNVLPAYLAAPKGQKHHAALIALSNSINQWKCQECLEKEKEWDVRVAALGAAINFFPCPDLLTSMLSMLEKVLEDRDEAMAGKVLGLLIQLVEPRFLVGQIGEWVKRMWQLANNDSLNVGTRCLAIEFLSKLAQVEEIAPWLQQNVRELFEILMNLWDYIKDDDPKADHVHAWESSNNKFWRKCWDMLLIAMGGNGIFYVALEVLPAYLNDLEWQKKHAAFIVLTQSIKSCGEVTIENLEKVVLMVLNTFPNANRHVRHAAVEAIRQLARHFSFGFGFGLCKEVMRTNIKQVIPILLSLFQDDDPVVQNASIHAIGELASTLGEHLQVRCDLMLPALAKVMNDSPNQDMRVNAASIILDFSKYCTRDNLREHCNGIISSCLIVSKEVKKLVMRIRWTELEMPSRHAMRDMLSWHDMFSCHDRMLSLEWFQLWTNEERDFSPYLEILMFPVFCAAAQLDLDVTRYDVVIMEKARACLVLCLCVDELTELLILEIDRVVDTLIPFLKWYHDPPVADALVPSVADALVPSAKLIRKAAASAITKILNSARDVVEFSDPEDYDHLKQDVEKLSDKVKHALKEASDVLSLAARRPHAHSRTTTPTGSTRKNSDEGCPGGIDILQTQLLSLQPRRIYSILSRPYNTFYLEYVRDCKSLKNCTPFGGGIGFLPRLISLYAIQCSEDEPKFRFLIRFPASGYDAYSNSQSFHPNTTLVGEGSWDEKKNRLCIVACRILNPMGSKRSAQVGDCSIRLKLSYPAIWTIRNSSTIIGQIWTNKTVKDSGYFERIVFRGSENIIEKLPGLKYEYTETESKTIMPNKEGCEDEEGGKLP